MSRLYRASQHAVRFISIIALTLIPGVTFSQSATPSNSYTPPPTVSASPNATGTWTPLPTGSATAVPTDSATPVPSGSSTPVPSGSSTPYPSGSATPVPTQPEFPEPEISVPFNGRTMENGTEATAKCGVDANTETGIYSFDTFVLPNDEKDVNRSDFISVRVITEVDPAEQSAGSASTITYAGKPHKAVPLAEVTITQSSGAFSRTLRGWTGADGFLKAEGIMFQPNRDTGSQLRPLNDPKLIPISSLYTQTKIIVDTDPYLLVKVEKGEISPTAFGSLDVFRLSDAAEELPSHFLKKFELPNAQRGGVYTIALGRKTGWRFNAGEAAEVGQICKDAPNTGTRIPEGYKFLKRVRDPETHRETGATVPYPAGEGIVAIVSDNTGTMLNTDTTEPGKLLVTAGAIEFEAFDAETGESLQSDPDQTSKIRFSVQNRFEDLPGVEIWTNNDNTGVWSGVAGNPVVRTGPGVGSGSGTFSASSNDGGESWFNGNIEGYVNFDAKRDAAGISVVACLESSNSAVDLFAECGKAKLSFLVNGRDQIREYDWGQNRIIPLINIIEDSEVGISHVSNSGAGVCPELHLECNNPVGEGVCSAGAKHNLPSGLPDQNTKTDFFQTSADPTAVGFRGTAILGQPGQGNVSDWTSYDIAEACGPTCNSLSYSTADQFAANGEYSRIESCVLGNADALAYFEPRAFPLNAGETGTARANLSISPGEAFYYTGASVTNGPLDTLYLVQDGVECPEALPFDQIPTDANGRDSLLTATSADMQEFLAVGRVDHDATAPAQLMWLNVDGYVTGSAKSEFDVNKYVVDLFGGFEDKFIRSAGDDPYQVTDALDSRTNQAADDKTDISLTGDLTFAAVYGKYQANDTSVNNSLGAWTREDTCKPEEKGLHVVSEQPIAGYGVQRFTPAGGVEQETNPGRVQVRAEELLDKDPSDPTATDESIVYVAFVDNFDHEASFQNGGISGAALDSVTGGYLYSATYEPVFESFIAAVRFKRHFESIEEGQADIPSEVTVLNICRATFDGGVQNGPDSYIRVAERGRVNDHSAYQGDPDGDGVNGNTTTNWFQDRAVQQMITNGNCPGLPVGCSSDNDGDGVVDCFDICPTDSGKIYDAGICGCNVLETDSDGDGTPDCIDLCPNDPLKIDPGSCGCGTVDTDTDGDGTPDCSDGCVNDSNKVEAGQCGCGNLDTDTDGDGSADCVDECDNDAGKTAPGQCGCGNLDTDTDGDGSADCVDECDNDATKTTPGQCGCGNVETDSDGDGSADCVDECDNDPAKTLAGQCGCGNADTDTDGDGTADCLDECDNDVGKTEPGQCGCGVADTDSDGDGIANCHDVCPFQDDRIDSDGDQVPDCIDACPADPDASLPEYCGCALGIDGFSGVVENEQPYTCTNTAGEKRDYYEPRDAIEVAYHGIRKDRSFAFTARSNGAAHADLVKFSAGPGGGVCATPIVLATSPENGERRFHNVEISTGLLAEAEALIYLEEDAIADPANPKADTLWWHDISIDGDAHLAYRIPLMSGEIKFDGIWETTSGSDWESVPKYALGGNDYAIVSEYDVDKKGEDIDGYLIEKSCDTDVPGGKRITKLPIESVPSFNGPQGQTIGFNGGMLQVHEMVAGGGDPQKKTVIGSLFSNYDLESYFVNGNHSVDKYITTVESGVLKTVGDWFVVFEEVTYRKGIAAASSETKLWCRATFEGRDGAAHTYRRYSDTDASGKDVHERISSLIAYMKANGECPINCEVDSDGDGVKDCDELCDSDPDKTQPGQCGCGNADTDDDGDGVANCIDQCAGEDDTVDSDGDGSPDCVESCDNDPAKIAPGQCGCGTADTDDDGDGVANCLDQCPGADDTLDTDGDGIADCLDPCPNDPTNSCGGDASGMMSNAFGGDAPGDNGIAGGVQTPPAAAGESELDGYMQAVQGLSISQLQALIDVLQLLMDSMLAADQGARSFMSASLFRSSGISKSQLKELPKDVRRFVKKTLKVQSLAGKVEPKVQNLKRRLDKKILKSKEKDVPQEIIDRIVRRTTQRMNKTVTRTVSKLSRAGRKLKALFEGLPEEYRSAEAV